MLETDLRQMFEQQASADQPPARISYPAARRSARAVRRWRLAAAVGSPLLAAGAVLAVALTSTIPASLHGTRPARSTAAGFAAPKVAAPREFNVLAPYASFGWLPAGKPEVTGGSTLAAMYLEADYSGNSYTWQANAAGLCKLAGHSLTCFGAGKVRITGRAPDIDGHLAYWGYFPLPPPGPVNRVLTYQYARGSWATLQFVGNKHRPDVLKIAQSVEIGQTAHLRFTVQLTGEPGWHVAAVNFEPTPSGPLATFADYTPRPLIVRQRPDGIAEYPLWISADPASHSNGSCATTKFAWSVIGGKTTNLGASTLRMINGYKVYENSRAASACADDADGLHVQVSADFQAPAVNVVTIFARHLRLLGTNPAHWTTKPVR
jgi:hypothetical protein